MSLTDQTDQRQKAWTGLLMVRSECDRWIDANNRPSHRKMRQYQRKMCSCGAVIVRLYGKRHCRLTCQSNVAGTYGSMIQWRDVVTTRVWRRIAVKRSFYSYCPVSYPILTPLASPGVNWKVARRSWGGALHKQHVTCSSVPPIRRRTVNYTRCTTPASLVRHCLCPRSSRE